MYEPGAQHVSTHTVLVKEGAGLLPNKQETSTHHQTDSQNPQAMGGAAGTAVRVQSKDRKRHAGEQ